VEQTVNWSSEDDGGSSISTLTGNGCRETLRSAVELVLSRRRPVRRVVVANTTPLIDRGADHNVSAVHLVPVPNTIFTSPYTFRIAIRKLQ